MMWIKLWNKSREQGFPKNDKKSPLLTKSDQEKGNSVAKMNIPAKETSSPHGGKEK